MSTQLSTPQVLSLIKSCLTQYPNLVSQLISPQLSISLESISQGQKIQQPQILKLSSLSNDVYQLRFKNGFSFIFKKYLCMLKQFVNREFQKKVLIDRMSNQDYPYIYCYDKKIRIQKFVQGRQINRQDLTQQVLINIVKELATFSTKYSYLNEHSPDCREISHLFEMFKMISQQKAKENPQVSSILDDKQIQKNIKQLVKPYPMILCHNDSNLSNLLLIESQPVSPKILLLDFQFSSLNYLCFDLSNLLNQLSTDYTNFQIRPEWQISSSIKQKMIQQYFYRVGGGVKDIQKCVQVGRMISHLYWGFVGVKQVDQNIGIDMVYYVKRRKQEFFTYYNRLVLTM